jgi:uncharacterized protein YndB with AHSA1/START domain
MSRHFEDKMENIEFNKKSKFNKKKKENIKIKGREFIITRIFDFPRELVFKAWTDPKHMVHWFGPRDFTIPVCNMVVRPDGAYRIVMRSKDKIDYPIKGIFLEVLEPYKLAMTEDISEHPEEWKNLVRSNMRNVTENYKKKVYENPAGTIILTVTFNDYGKKTEQVIHLEFESTAIRDAMVSIGLEQGWNESLDRLVECLEKLEIVEIYDF